MEIFSDQNVCEQVTIPYTNDLGESKSRTVMKQTPAKVSDLSAKWIFSDLRGQKANVFEGKIVPSVPTCQARNVYDAFSVLSPVLVRRNVANLEPEFGKKPGNTKLTRILAFSKAALPTDEEILLQRKKSKNARTDGEEEVDNSKTAEAQNQSSQSGSNTAQQKSSAPVSDNDQNKSTGEATGAAVKPGRGRKPGSKNRKTLEYEAKVASGEIEPKPLRRPGRPPGAKNKKTLEYEQALKEGKVQPPAKGQPGRPVGRRDSSPRTRRTKQQILDAQQVASS